MRRALTSWTLALCAIGAQAQTAAADPGGNAPLACLVRPAAPQYPDEALKARRGGFYRLELTFTDAESAPKVKVLFGAGSAPLLEAVELYADAFRLPCLKEGETWVMQQEIRFRGVDGGEVTTQAPLDTQRSPNARYIACMRTPPEGPRLAGPLMEAYRRERTGNLVLDMTFTASDQSPQIKVLYDTVSQRSRNDFIDYASQYRVPCLDAGASVTIRQVFQSGSSGNRNFAFKDVGIVQFLSGVKDVDARPVHFELDTMGCPFRLSFKLGWPALPNVVTQIGEVNPNRLAFIAWLKELELKLKPEQFESLLGAEMFIDVPCGTVKLG